MSCLSFVNWYTQWLHQTCKYWFLARLLWKSWRVLHGRSLWRRGCRVKSIILCPQFVLICFWSPIAMYQGPQALDSVLNYPMYSALLSGFSIPGPLNISAIVDVFQQSKVKFTVGLSLLQYRCCSCLTITRTLVYWETFWKTRIFLVGAIYRWILKACSTSLWVRLSMFTQKYTYSQQRHDV